VADMRDDLEKALLPEAGDRIDPVELARRDQKKALPKRFYKEASTEQDGDVFALVLDGRRARTPARNIVATPSQELSRLLAAEWNAQGEYIDPADMPLTRLVNSALDSVTRELAATAAEVVKYAGSDLLCYRAADPEALVREQIERWNPVLAWARETIGARFNLAEGVMFVDQPPGTLDAFAKATDKVIGNDAAAPLRAAAMNVVTTLTGSAILALAIAHDRLSAQDAWSIAHLDEDFQIRAWGHDAEAEARRARRWLEMEAACSVLAHLRKAKCQDFQGGNE